MKLRKIILTFLLLQLILMPASAGIIDWIRGLSITSYASNVPVTIDYDNQANYWMLSANIGSRTDELNIALPASTEIKLDENTAIKTGQSVSLILKPNQPYSATTLLKGGDIRYISNLGVFGIGRTYTPAPYYDVSSGTWLTKSTYSVTLAESQGGAQASSNVEVSYLDRQTIYLRDSRGYTATLQNQGTLLNGITPPGGSLVVVKDPGGIRHLYEKNSFSLAVSRANDYIDNFWLSNSIYGAYVNPAWTDVWAIMKNQGLPSEIPTSGQLSYPTDTNIKVTYPTGSFSAVVTLMIPSAMANSVTINLHASMPNIVDKRLTDVTETEAAILTVKVKNVGTDDYINVAPTSNFYTFSPLSDSRQYVKSQETATFSWRAIATDVPSDTEATVNILAEGTAGYERDTAKGMIYDKPQVVYCDAVRKLITGCGEKTTWVLRVTATTPDGSTVYTAGPIYVNGELKATGMYSAEVPKGDYIVAGANTSDYFAPTPLKVTIIDQDRQVSLVYSKIPKSQEQPKFDWANVVWLGILSAIIFAVWHFRLWTYVQPLLMMLKNPLVLLASPQLAVVAVVLLVIIVIILWRIYSLLSNIGGDILGVLGW